jgi:hypothetical protein
MNAAVRSGAANPGCGVNSLGRHLVHGGAMGKARVESRRRSATPYLSGLGRPYPSTDSRISLIALVSLGILLIAVGSALRLLHTNG